MRRLTRDELKELESMREWAIRRVKRIYDINFERFVEGVEE